MNWQHQILVVRQKKDQMDGSSCAELVAVVVQGTSLSLVAYWSTKCDSTAMWRVQKWADNYYFDLIYWPQMRLEE